MEIRCENCKWWEEFGLVNEDHPDCGTEGLCCRYAPRLVEGMLFTANECDISKQQYPMCWENLRAVWPLVGGWKWCGEFEPEGDHK